MTFQELKRFAEAYTRLQKIARKLHRYFESECNYGLTERQARTVSKLIESARQEAEGIGLGLYVNGDPRGLPLHLVPADWDTETARARYTEGIPIIF